MIFTIISTLTLSQAVNGENSQKPAIPMMVWGSEHEKLDRLAGTWATHQNMNFRGENHIVEGMETYAWQEPTRVWLLKQVAMTDHPILGEMNGLELWGYDAKNNEVVKYWFDNQSPETFPNRGKWVDDDRLVMTGMIVWEGRNMYLQNVIAFSGNDDFVWTHSQSWDTDDDFQERSRVQYRRIETAAPNEPNEGRL